MKYNPVIIWKYYWRGLIRYKEEATGDMSIVITVLGQMIKDWRSLEIRDSFLKMGTF